MCPSQSLDALGTPASLARASVLPLWAHVYAPRTCVVEAAQLACLCDARFSVAGDFCMSIPPVRMCVIYVATQHGCFGGTLTSRLGLTPLFTADEEQPGHDAGADADCVHALALVHRGRVVVHAEVHPGGRPRVVRHLGQLVRSGVPLGYGVHGMGRNSPCPFLYTLPLQSEYIWASESYIILATSS